MAIDTKKLAAILEKSYKADAVRKQVAEDIVEAAKEVFSSQEIKTNEGATSETTPPKYLASFGVAKEDDVWHAYNDDPGAVMVEFGAHAGGETPVLKYAPLRRGVDVVKGERGA